MVHGVEHAAERGGSSQAEAQRQDAHVLDARVGEHPLVVALTWNEDGRHRHREQPEPDQQSLTERRLPGRRAHLLRSHDAEERAVEERAREQRRHHRGRFAVGVGEPRVQGGEPHLGTVADQEEEERRSEPRDAEIARAV